MASAASAISLSNFQLITSAEVPLSCILAYNSRLAGCSTSDFTQGSDRNTCSAACKKALQNVEDTLTSACGGANVPSSSVLGVALSGGLLGLLCPSGESSATAAATTSDPSQTTTRHIGTFSPIPPPPTLWTTTTSSSSSSSTTDEGSETESQTSATSTERVESQTTETTQTTQAAPPPAVTSSADAKSAQTTSARQTSAPPQTTSDRGPGVASPGAASPFDIAAVSSGSQRLADWRPHAFLFANVFFIILLLR